VAKTKQYKDVRQGRYESKGLDQYYIGPFDKTHGWDTQNAPNGGNKGQFGKKDGKSEAD